MGRVVFVVPGALDALTGGSIYDRRIVEGLRRRRCSVDVIELHGCFPAPSHADVSAAADAFSRLQDGTTTVVDGLVFGALPDIVEANRQRLRLVVIVHMPLADECGLDESIAHARRDSERRALAAASKIIVTGRSTFDTLAVMGSSGDRVVLIEPGTDAAPTARGSSAGAIRLLCVAAITSGKGHDVLVRALARLRDRDWTLT